MTDTPTPEETRVSATMETDPIDDEALKKRLLKQLAVAAVVLAGLMSSLLIYDGINAPSPSAPASLAVPPPAPEPLATAREPAIAEPAVKEAAKEPSEDAIKSPPPTAKEEEGVPEGTGAPQTVPPRARPGEKPLTKPATSRLAALHPAGPNPPAASRPEPAQELVRSKPSPTAAAPAQRVPEHQPASRPITQATERNFGLQLGVFSNLANAEELRARMVQGGIPATIEARVRAGPFATRAEADAARVKLKELGITDSVLISMKPRAGP